MNLDSRPQKNNNPKEIISELLFDISPDPMFILDGDKYIDCNKAALKVFGYQNKDDFMLKTPWELSPFKQPDGSLSKDKARDMIGKILSGETLVFDWVHHTKAGEPLWFSISLVKIPSNGTKHIFATFRNITVRKEAEKKLQDAKNLFTAAIEQSPSGILIADAPSGNIRIVNQAALFIRGQTNKLLTTIEFAEHSKNWQTYYLDGSVLPSEELPLSRAVIHGEHVHNEELIIMNSEGEKRFVSSNAAPIRNEKGEITAGIVVFHDITMQKEGEQELLRRNAEKDTFISVMTHDLRNIIGRSVQIFEMLGKPNLKVEKRNMLMAHLEENAYNSFSLLQSLIEWAKATRDKEVFRPQKCSLKEVICKNQQLFVQQLAEKNIQFINSVVSDTEIIADYNMLNAIFRNLINNAIKYTSKEGSIELTSECSNEEIKVCVADSGIGMSLEKSKQLFSTEHIISEPGTEGEKGHGLGLQIVKEYVHSHDGKIWAESGPGKGTRIFFTLPKVCK